MHYDPHYYPSASRRMVTFGKRGMVATSQSLAAQVGIDILRKGGNAIDAAIATAAALTVVEPTSNGIGSDAFALVWVKVSYMASMLAALLQRVFHAMPLRP